MEELFKAIGICDETKVREILNSKDIDINGKDDYGATLIFNAISNGSKEIVQMLLDKGADPNIPYFLDDNYRTPLMSLALEHYEGYMEILQVLLNYPINFDIQDDDGNTALHYSTNNGLDDMTKTLIDAGADVNILNNEKETPLMEIAYQGNVELAKLMIEKGAEINVENTYNFTAIMYAAKFDRVEMVEYLLNQGAIFNDFYKDEECEEFLKKHPEFLKYEIPVKCGIK